MSDPEFFLGRMEEERFNLPSTTFLTHAAVLGASGSGKTVMCKSIVEEAVRNGIPIIAVDPKGDIGALGIGLGDFSDPEKIIIHAKVEADDRGGGDPNEIAVEWLELYREKLEESFGSEYMEVEEDFSKKVAVILITPKNSAGIQISLTPTFEKPSNYEELMTEEPDALLSALDLKIQLLLSRCGIGTSSSTDNRVIFINTLIRHLWEEKVTNVELVALIEKIQEPPFEKVGSLSVEKFISKNKRAELARNINALMVRAVPGVELNFDKLIDLAKKEKKTPIIVFDLRKITDNDEKNTFVAEILGEVQRWAWSKGGTSRLRAILFFDELYGFMPAGSFSPPSKTALLILLKQARAAGLGCVLATQNPGDLDYRGLSNIATWILGRLATNQDIAKVQGALKPVFEGAGGSESEFRDLMNQIRALKPGNFIAYNPLVGVKRIKTRWLLSLHKGPLTDEEIKVLTLKPPKPVKKEKKKKTTEAEAVEKVEEREFPLSMKKPAIGKITERFLSPKIPLEGKRLIKAVFDRMNILGDPALDGFKVVLGEADQFYSPLYFSKTVINIKRTIKEGIIEFPIEINEEMPRTFDLSQREIRWDSTVIEGIHASSLPPNDLSIQPLEGWKYYKIDKEIIPKLPDNLTWYFTQQPFPEAANIYRQRLREFEREEIDKLAGEKVSKALKKISNQISTIEEKMETENQKLDETILRLETLQGEKRAREAEYKSTKAIERSIESSELKISKHEDRVKNFQSQLKDTEKNRQKLLEEQKETYAEFHKTIEVLKSKGVPPDLHRLAKSDVKISEKAVYWIPRLLIPVTMSIPDTEIEELTLVNLNLYNGNGEIACTGCGPTISTEDYYQNLLESEISPPTFICSVCARALCSEHVAFCKECGKKACPDHSMECSVCKTTLCRSCAAVSETGVFLCSEHSWTCIVCSRAFSDKISYKMGHLEQKPVCEECEEGYLFPCDQCGQINSQESMKLCEGCSKAFCPEHLSPCRKCSTLVCPECGRVKVRIKNEDVIARCINCS